MQQSARHLTGWKARRMAVVLLKILLVSLPLHECVESNNEYGSEKIDQILKELKSDDVSISPNKVNELPKLSNTSFVLSLENVGASREEKFQHLKLVTGAMVSSKFPKMLAADNQENSVDSSAQRALDELRAATSSLKETTHGDFNPHMVDTSLRLDAHGSNDKPMLSRTIDEKKKYAGLEPPTFDAARDISILSHSPKVSDEVLKDLKIASLASITPDTFKTRSAFGSNKQDVKLAFFNNGDDSVRDLQSTTVGESEGKKEDLNLNSPNRQRDGTNTIDKLIRDLKASTLTNTNQENDIDKGIKVPKTDSSEETSTPGGHFTIDQMLQDLKFAASTIKLKGNNAVKEEITSPPVGLDEQKVKLDLRGSVYEGLEQMVKDLKNSALANENKKNDQQNEAQVLEQSLNPPSWLTTPTKSHVTETHSKMISSANSPTSDKFDQILANLHGASTGAEKLSISLTSVDPKIKDENDAVTSLVSTHFNKFDEIISKLQAVGRVDEHHKPAQDSASDSIQSLLEISKAGKSKNLHSTNAPVDVERKMSAEKPSWQSELNITMSTSDNSTVTNITNPCTSSTTTAKEASIDEARIDNNNNNKQLLAAEATLPQHKEGQNKDKKILDPKEESHLRWEALREEQRRVRQMKQQTPQKTQQKQTEGVNEDGRDDDNARLMAQMVSLLSLKERVMGSEYEKALEQLDAVANFASEPLSKSSMWSTSSSLAYSTKSSEDTSSDSSTSEWGSRIFDADSLNKAHNALSALSNVGKSGLLHEAPSLLKSNTETSTKDAISSMFSHLYARDSITSSSAPTSPISNGAERTNAAQSSNSLESRLQNLFNSFNSSVGKNEEERRDFFQGAKLDDVQEEVYDKLATNLNNRLGFAAVPQDVPPDPAVVALKKQLNLQTKLLKQKNDANAKLEPHIDVANSELLKDSKTTGDEKPKAIGNANDLRNYEASNESSQTRKGKNDFSGAKENSGHHEEVGTDKANQTTSTFEDRDSLVASPSDVQNNLLDASIKKLQDQPRPKSVDQEGEFPAPKPPKSKGDVMAFIKNNIIKQRKSESVKAEAKQEEEEKFWALHLKNSQASI